MTRCGRNVEPVPHWVTRDDPRWFSAQTGYSSANTSPSPNFA